MKEMHGKQYSVIFPVGRKFGGPKVRWAKSSMGQNIDGSKVQRPRDLLNMLESQFATTVPKYGRTRCA